MSDTSGQDTSGGGQNSVFSSKPFQTLFQKYVQLVAQMHGGLLPKNSQTYFQGGEGTRYGQYDTSQNPMQISGQPQQPAQPSGGEFGPQQQQGGPDFSRAGAIAGNALGGSGMNAANRLAGSFAPPDPTQQQGAPQGGPASLMAQQGAGAPPQG